MTTHHGTHNDLHSEQGGLRGEHPGRATNPTIKAQDLAWLEFQKPDLAGSERFAHAFGFSTVSRTSDELQLRGTDSGAPCVIVRRGPRSTYLGAAFRAADPTDVLRLADATGGVVTKLPDSLGGITVDLTDPSGVLVRVVNGTHAIAMTRKLQRILLSDVFISFISCIKAEGFTISAGFPAHGTLPPNYRTGTSLSQGR